MNQSLYLTNIIEAFEHKIEEYADESQAIDFYFVPEYKGAEDIDHLTHYEGFIEYDEYSLIFRFTVHTFLSQVNHILDAWVCFDDSYYCYPLHHMVGYYHILLPDALVIPCISNPLTMNESLDYLKTNIDCVMDILLEEDRQDFYDDFKTFVCTYSHIKSDEYDEEFHYAFIEDVQIFETDIAYINYLLRNNELALKKYKKKKNLTYYEQWIVKMIEQGYSLEEDLPYSVVYHLQSFDKSGAVKVDFKELMLMLISVVILTGLWGVFYFLFHKGLSLILLRDVIYFLGEDPFFIFLPSFISAIACSYFTRHTFYKFFFKKMYADYLERDFLTNTPKSNQFMYHFVKWVLILSLIFVFLLTNTNVQFKTDGIVDNTKFFSLKGNEYYYQDIEIHYYKDQKNGFDELIGAPTYVIYTPKGDIDLYPFIDAKDFEKQILPYMKEKGVKLSYKDILEWK